MHEETKRRGTGGVVFIAAAAVLVFYTVLTALNGDFGLLRLYQIKSRETQLREQLAGLEATNAALLNKNLRLSSERPDLELLDHRARTVLGLGQADEIIIR